MSYTEEFDALLERAGLDIFERYKARRDLPESFQITLVSMDKIHQEIGGWTMIEDCEEIFADLDERRRKGKPQHQATLGPRKVVIP